MDGKYVAYYRVSTAKQGVSGLGLEAQQRAVREYLNGGAWELIGEFTEVESGKKNHRPRLADAFSRCRMTGATLVIAKLDRLSRNASFLIGLKEQGIEFVCCDMPDANKLTVGIMALLAEHEREAISRRTKEALGSIKARLANGQTHISKAGNEILKLGNPEGLKHRTSEAGVKASKTRADNFAKMVAPTIRNLKDAGLSFATIADRLNELSVKAPRGGKWAAMTVKRVLDRL